MLLLTCLILLLLFVVVIGLFRDLIYAAVALALSSAMVAMILFIFSANTAAVFELSVCAGLITVLFVSTVSLTKDSDQKTENRYAMYLFPAFVLLFLGIDFVLVKWLVKTFLVAPESVAGSSFRHMFWATRATDLLAQVSLILAGVFGILAIFKRNPEGGKHHE